MFENLRIRWKLISGFAVLLLLLGAVAVLFQLNLLRVKGSIPEIEQLVADGEQLNSVKDAAVGYQRRLDAALYSRSDIAFDNLAKAAAFFDGEISAAAAKVHNRDEVRNLQTLKARLQRVGASVKEFREALQRGDDAASARLLKDRIEPEGEEIGQLASDSSTAAMDGIGSIGARLNQDIETSLYRSMLVTTLAVAIGFILAYAISLAITGPTVRLTGLINELARGRLDLQVPFKDRRDEIGDTARALEVFRTTASHTDQLNSRITENSHAVANAVGQASAAVSHVSDGSTTQLRALQRVASAMGQTTGAIADVSRSTQEASEQTKTAAGRVGEGLDRVAAMVMEVEAIAVSSSKVSKIADAIGRLAGQTNMLSLNAAIEAAHAGAEGKGFAVVAEEVRKLADNTGGLAQEIAELVAQATDQAQRGVMIAQDVSSDMKLIADSVAASDRLIGGIAVAMEEQQQTVAEINTSLAELTRIGQSNATAAEEITANMLDLSRLAERSRTELTQSAGATAPTLSTSLHPGAEG
jgi:methyl-accepting chemotaxis protein